MRRNRGGFTFIEIMIVIVVLSIGVLAILKMVTYNLGTMDKIRVRTVATLLAKESMSLAFNLRDSNRLAGLPWDCVPNKQYNDQDATKLDVCEDYLISGHQNMPVVWMFGVDINGFVDIRKSPVSSNWQDLFANTKLSLLSGTTGFPIQYYGTGQDISQDTYFARYISFTGVVESGQILPMDKLVKIESHVLYSKGSSTGEVVLESFIGNY